MRFRRSLLSRTQERSGESKVSEPRGRRSPQRSCCKLLVTLIDHKKGEGKADACANALQELHYVERRIPLMDDASRNVVTARRCPQCDTPADDGLIFCRNCGAALRPPLPLTRPVVRMDGAPSNTIGLAKRILIVVLKGIAGIAAIVAIFCTLGSFTQIFLFAVSAAVALIFYAALT